MWCQRGPWLWSGVPLRKDGAGRRLAAAPVLANKRSCIRGLVCAEYRKKCLKILGLQTWPIKLPTLNMIEKLCTYNEDGAICHSSRYTGNGLEIHMFVAKSTRV
jgi:hypothetical protein